MATARRRGTAARTNAGPGSGRDERPAHRQMRVLARRRRRTRNLADAGLPRLPCSAGNSGVSLQPTRDALGADSATLARPTVSRPWQRSGASPVSSGFDVRTLRGGRGFVGAYKYGHLHTPADDDCFVAHRDAGATLLLRAPVDPKQKADAGRKLEPGVRAFVEAGVWFIDELALGTRALTSRLSHSRRAVHK